ncbi:MAG: hypothetical protein D6753_16705, partial [Planctomycetota bacterium]
MGIWILSFGLAVPLRAIEDDGQASPFRGPVRIAKLLWNANPQSAASTLESAFARALARNQLDQLATALGDLRPKMSEIVASNQLDDPRFGASLAGMLTLPDPDAPLPAQLIRRFV